MVTEKIFETALGIKQPLVHRRDELRAHPEEAKYPCRFRGWQPLCRAGAGRNGPDPPMQRSAYAGQLDLLKLSSVWCIPRHLEQFRHAHFTCSEIYGSRYSDATPLKFSTHTLPADHTSHQILSVPPQRTPRFYIFAHSPTKIAASVPKVTTFVHADIFAKNAVQITKTAQNV